MRDPSKPQHPELEHQDPYALRHRHPDDEQTLNWEKFVRSTAPADPYEPLAVVPQDFCPFPPNAVVEQPATHHTQNETYPDPFKKQDNRVIVQQWWLGQRQEAWMAYRESAMQIQTMEEALAPDLNQFFHAEKNNDLKALGFIMAKGYKGNLLDLTSKQEVPTRGGPQIGGLFKGDNSLNTTKADEKAINTSAAALQHGKGGAEAGFLGTTKADSDLKAELSKVKAAADTAIAANEKLNSATAAVKYAEAQEKADEAQAEIKELTEQAEQVKSIIEFTVGAPEKLAKLAEEGINKLEAVGTIASLMLDIFPSAAMDAAKAKLAAAQTEMKTEKGKQLQADLNAAKAGLRAALESLAGEKSALASAMTARRQAYNAAGVAAGAAAGGSTSSQQKVAGIIAAIPIVETAVAALRNITDKTMKVRPPYTEKAGLGYGIAVSHKFSQALNLPNAIGILEYCNLWFGSVQADWTERLNSLMAAKERIAGTRPGD